MNGKDFYALVDRRLEKTRDVLISKGKQYSKEQNKLYNFRRAAKINQVPLKVALWSMSTKHLVSIIDMVESDQHFDDDYIDEKIGDMINYLILLEAALKK